MKKIYYYINLVLGTVFLSTIGHAQTVSEDFNQGGYNSLQSRCWESTNFEVNSNNPITTTSPKKHGATVDMSSTSIWDIFSQSTLTSPYIYFDGSGNVTFKHKADHDYPWYVYSQLDLYLLSPDGTMSASVFTHNYKYFTAWGNGDPTLVQNSTLPITWTGYYRLIWVWQDFASTTEFYIDDIVIEGSKSADTTQEYQGFCPAIMYAADTVCGGEQDDQRTTLYPRASRSYAWSFTGATGGTFDLSLTTNDQTVETDWTVTNGDYQILAQESANGNYAGNKTYFDIHVLDQPTGDVDQVDTLCENIGGDIVFTFTGTGPFTFTFQDDLGLHTLVSNSTTYTYTPSGPIEYITLQSVIDGNGCPADNSVFFTYYIDSHARPSTGLIIGP